MASTQRTAAGSGLHESALPRYNGGNTGARETELVACKAWGLGSSSARPKLNRTGKSASCCSLGLRPSQQLAADQRSCIAENKYLRGASSKTHHPVSSRGLVVEIEAYVLRRGAFAHDCRYLRSTSARTENIRSKSPQYAASDSRSRIER